MRLDSFFFVAVAVVEECQKSRRQARLLGRMRPFCSVGNKCGDVGSKSGAHTDSRTAEHITLYKGSVKN